MSRLILVMGPYMYTLSAARYVFMFKDKTSFLLHELLSCFILGTTWCSSTTAGYQPKWCCVNTLGYPTFNCSVHICSISP